MASKPANIDELLCTPAFGIYDNVLITPITNKPTGQVFDMDNLGMMDVKNLNYVFSEYNKKARGNDTIFSAMNIKQLLALHRHVQGRFLCGQAATAAYILPILSNIEQDYTATSSGIGAEYKDTKSAVTPIIFNSPDKVIPLLS